MHNPPAALDLEDVKLTLSSVAGPVNILNGVSLRVAEGETVESSATRNTFGCQA